MNDHFLYLAAGMLLGAALVLAIRTHILEGVSVVDAAFADLPETDEVVVPLPGPRLASVPQQRQPIDHPYDAEKDGL